MFNTYCVGFTLNGYTIKMSISIYYDKSDNSISCCSRVSQRSWSIIEELCGSSHQGQGQVHILWNVITCPLERNYLSFDTCSWHTSPQLESFQYIPISIDAHWLLCFCWRSIFIQKNATPNDINMIYYKAYGFGLGFACLCSQKKCEKSMFYILDLVPAYNHNYLTAFRTYYLRHL